MALRIVQKQAVIIHHWSSHQLLLSGPTQIHEDAFIFEIPDKCTHEERVAYMRLAIEALKEKNRK